MSLLNNTFLTRQVYPADLRFGQPILASSEGPSAFSPSGEILLTLPLPLRLVATSPAAQWLKSIIQQTLECGRGGMEESEARLCPEPRRRATA